MTEEQLKQKYGDEQVVVIPTDAVDRINNSHAPFYSIADLDFCMGKSVDMYRWQAENDPSYKQIIPYVILSDGQRIFTTQRLQGDPRLTGKYSIGTGGHLQPSESLTQGLFRELEEEVGLNPDNLILLKRLGYILDETSPVNSVHLGVLYMAVVSDPSRVSVRETDKLSGRWCKADVLRKMEGLEDWSDIALQHL